MTRPVKTYVFRELWQLARSKETNVMKTNPAEQDLIGLVIVILPSSFSRIFPRECSSGTVSATRTADVPKHSTSFLIMEPVTQLDEDFTWIVEVESAKGLAIVQHDATICHIQSGHGNREILTEVFAEREIKRCVCRQVV